MCATMVIEKILLDYNAPYKSKCCVSTRDAFVKLNEWIYPKEYNLKRRHKKRSHEDQVG